MKIRDFPSLSEAISFVCSTVQLSLQRDIKEKGQASLILTGGQTVRPFLEALKTLDIPWEKVWVMLSDERWVPVTDEMSNERQLRELFLNHLKSLPRYVSLKTNHASPVEAILHLESRITDIPRPLSCGLLSIGDDGHIASLFPSEALKWMKDKDAKSFFASSQRGGRLSLGPPLLGEIKSAILLQNKARLLNEEIHPIIPSVFSQSYEILRF